MDMKIRTLTTEQYRRLNELAAHGMIVQTVDSTRRIYRLIRGKRELAYGTLTHCFNASR